MTPKSPADIKDFSVPLNLFREDLEVQGVPCVHWSHGRGTLITVGGAPLILENISSLSRGFLESHMDPDVEEWALDLREHLGRMQLSKTLGEGQLCPRCIQGTGELSRESCARGFGSSLRCICLCHESGYIRKPSFALHLLPVKEGGQLPDEFAHHSPFLLSHHARLVASGKPGIVKVLWEWVPSRSFPGFRRSCLSHGAHAFVLETPDTSPPGTRCPWGWSFRHMNGPETGEEGKNVVDSRLLKAGYALIDVGTVRVGTEV